MSFLDSREEKYSIQVGGFVTYTTNIRVGNYNYCIQTEESFVQQGWIIVAQTWKGQYKDISREYPDFEDVWHPFTYFVVGTVSYALHPQVLINDKIILSPYDKKGKNIYLIG